MSLPARALVLVCLSLLPGSAGLRGSPVYLNGLNKVGNGRSARWAVGTYESDEHELDVVLGLDRNPAARCIKLEFTDGGKKMGRMLLENRDAESALRGMAIAEGWRGRGLSKLLLAVWLRVCTAAGARPCTAVINKPLIALGLESFGFAPRAGRGVPVPVSDAVRFNDCLRSGWVTDASDADARIVRVHTEFEPPADARALSAAISAVLGGGRVRLHAPPSALGAALTLRGGGVRLPSLPFPRYVVGMPPQRYIWWMNLNRSQRAAVRIACALVALQGAKIGLGLASGAALALLGAVKRDDEYASSGWVRRDLGRLKA